MSAIREREARKALRSRPARVLGGLEDLRHPGRFLVPVIGEEGRGRFPVGFVHRKKRRSLCLFVEFLRREGVPEVLAFGSERSRRSEIGTEDRVLRSLGEAQGAGPESVEDGRHVLKQGPAFVRSPVVRAETVLEHRREGDRILTRPGGSVPQHAEGSEFEPRLLRASFEFRVLLRLLRGNEEGLPVFGRKRRLREKVPQARPAA